MPKIQPVSMPQVSKLLAQLADWPQEPVQELPLEPPIHLEPAPLPEPLASETSDQDPAEHQRRGPREMRSTP